MKEFMKKAGISFWLTAAAAVIALVGAILFAVTNSTAGYAVLNGGWGLALAFIAVVAVGGGAYVTVKFGAQHYITAIVKLVALVFLCIALGVLLGDRVGLAADLFTWDSHNAIGWNVLYMSIAAAVVIIVAVLALIACAFFGDKKKA